MICEELEDLMTSDDDASGAFALDELFSEGMLMPEDIDDDVLVGL